MKVHKKETLAYISTDRMTGKQLHFVIGTHQKKKKKLQFVLKWVFLFERYRWSFKILQARNPICYYDEVCYLFSTWR